MEQIHGWLRKAGQKGMNTFKKKYFRQRDSELHYFENDKSDESQGFINLADVINLFPEGRPKQGIFILLTQSRAWKLQAVGDDPDMARSYWMRQLEAWLNENRPGFKKLKKMGFDKPTQVPSSPIAQKRTSVSSSTDLSSGEMAVGRSPPSSEPPPDMGLPSPKKEEESLENEYGVNSMKASALNYRRLELQIKVALDSMSSSAGNAELLKRVKELEEEREEKRAAASMREFELSELERTYSSIADESRADFAELLQNVSELQSKLLKPGFETVQSVFEAVQMGDEPSLSRPEVFELISNFDEILTPVETALTMSTTLLQKDRADVLNRVAALEAEIKSLQESVDELDEKKLQVEQSAEHLRTISSQIKQVATVFPSVSFSKDESVEWLKSHHAEGDDLQTGLKKTRDALADGNHQAVNENLRLMQMEKIGAESPNIVFNEDGSIKMATTDALFSLLINGEGRIKHPEFENAILYGFPSFAQPMDLLEKIVLCFCSTLPPNFSGSRQRAEAIIEMNRKRLLNLVNRWILYHEHHFRERSFSKFFGDFIVTVELSGLKEEATKLRDKLSNNIFPFTGDYEKSLLPPDLNNFQLLDLAPMEIARQMTRIDAALFEVIETRDFLETAWTNKNPNVAQSVKAITKHFNRMSAWVTSEILFEEDLKRRAGVIELFIQTAECCLQISNFNGLLQIIGALSKTEIHRLTNSWELVAKEKMKLMEAHRELLSSNCAQLRQRYAAAKPPCLPYLGTYLTDLVMIGEQKTRVGDKINYRKLQLQEKSLSALVRRTEEGIKFPFREVKEIRSYIMDDSHLITSDDELMRRSQELEPRAAEGGTARLSKTKSVAGLMRNDTPRKIVRKQNSGSDRNTMQFGSSPVPGAKSPNMSQTLRPSASATSIASSGSPRTAITSTADRMPPPSSPPVHPGAHEHSTAFRSARPGLRASSPAGQIGALRESSPVSSSPMIGKRSATTMRHDRTSHGSGSAESVSPDNGPDSPKGGGGSMASAPGPVVSPGRPVPAPRRSPIQSRRAGAPAPLAKSPMGAARSPKPLPKPPASDDDEDDDEEDSSEDIQVARGNGTF